MAIHQILMKQGNFVHVLYDICFEKLSTPRAKDGVNVWIDPMKNNSQWVLSLHAWPPSLHTFKLCRVGLPAAKGGMLEVEVPT